MKACLEAVPHGMLVVDENYQILGWNGVLENWTARSADEALGKNLLALYPRLATPRYLARMTMAFESGCPAIFSSQLHKYFLECPDQEGRPRLQNTTVTPLRRADGSSVAVIFMEDVSETARKIKKFRQMRDAAVKSARIKSEFTATVSHELRTPMNGILGMTELLLDKQLEPDVEEQVASIRNCAQSLLTVLNEILDFSKLEAGQFAVHPQDFDLDRELKILCDLFRTQASEKNLRFIVEGPGEALRLHGDCGRIRQVLINLLGNAFKFTDVGRVVLKAEPQSFQGDTVMMKFSVEDSGVGIPESQTSAIFESYTQADNGNTRRYGGTGLGLAISKNLVEQLGGAIEVQSWPGQGSVFSFELPLKRIRERPPASSSEGPLTLGHHVLVVDDNLLNRKVCLGFLSKLGCSAVAATDGRDALLKFREQLFDLVLMDIQMPVMDGLEATGQIRSLEQELGRRTPVVALTAHATESWKEQCRKADMDAHLSKPLSLKKLQECMRRLIPEAAPADSNSDPYPPDS